MKIGPFTISRLKKDEKLLRVKQGHVKSYQKLAENLNGDISKDDYEIRFEKVKKVADKNELHPELKAPIEKAFKIKDIQYWTFKNTLDMPAKRYHEMDRHKEEAELRITKNELDLCLDIQEKAFNAGDITGAIQITQALRHCTSSYIEIETFYRLYSNVFFTLEEDLTNYDYDFNAAKIELFKTEKTEDFFLKKPMKDYLPPIGISKQDLVTWAKESKAKNAYLSETKSRISKRIAEGGTISGGP